MNGIIKMIKLSPIKGMRLTTLLLIFLLSACSENTEQTMVVDNKTVNNKATGVTKLTPNYQLSNISKQAWLREKLPNNILAYARVPSVWYLFSGQDNGFKYAQGNPNFVTQVKQIQTAIKLSLYTHLELESGLAKFLLQHIDGPIEAAVLQPELGQMMPIVALASHLKFDSLTEFKAAFTAMAEQDPFIDISQVIDEQGHGELLLKQQVKIAFYYDDKTSQFSLYGGMGVDSLALKNVQKTLVNNAEHLMFKTEKTIDSSGLGLFVWLNPKIILPAVMPLVGEDKLAQLKRLGVADMNGIALGYGVSDGKTRLKTLIDMPMVGMRQYLPAINNNLTLMSSGKVNTVALLSIPTGKDVVKFEQGLTAMTGQLPPEYQEFKTRLQTELGFSLEELLHTIGPEMVYFSDEISEFSAVKLNDKNKFQQMLATLENKALIELSQHTVKGAVIHQVITSNEMMDNLYQPMFKEAPLLAEMLSKMKNRTYWLIENDYLILSSIPQPLIERSLHQNKQSIATWLAEHQQQNVSGSLFAYSSTIDNLSRNSYHIYLAVLQFVADISEAEFDIFTLPLANELAFAEEGTIGVQLDFSDPYIALEFTFEQSLLDVFYAGGYQSLAVVGILSAVAIPAYQDYIKRAKQATTN